jgi:hypothetical protein
VRHPYIVGFMQAFTEKNDKELNIIMEFCGCGDLVRPCACAGRGGLPAPSGVVVIVVA